MGYQKVARGFYEGIVQATHEAKATLLPLWLERLKNSEYSQEAETKLAYTLYIRKRMLTNPQAGDVEHSVSHFALQYFACIAALNLLRLPDHAESYKVDLLQEEFSRLAQEQEMEWLGIYNAELVDFERSTSFSPSQWRLGLSMQYLQNLQGRSSLDADTLVAARLFFTALGLNGGTKNLIPPAMLEHFAAEIAPTANWLKNYLHYNDF